MQLREVGSRLQRCLTRISGYYKGFNYPDDPKLQKKQACSRWAVMLSVVTWLPSFLLLPPLQRKATKWKMIAVFLFPRLLCTVVSMIFVYIGLRQIKAPFKIIALVWRLNEPVYVSHWKYFGPSGTIHPLSLILHLWSCALCPFYKLTAALG